MRSPWMGRISENAKKLRCVEFKKAGTIRVWCLHMDYWNCGREPRLWSAPLGRVSGFGCWHGEFSDEACLMLWIGKSKM